MLDQASGLSEFRAMLGAAFGELDSSALASALAGGLSAAQAAGRSDLASEAAE